MIIRSAFLSLIFLNTMASNAQLLPSHVYEWNDLKVESKDKFDRRAILQGGTNELEYFEIHSTTVIPGAVPRPPKVHNDVEELVIIKEGTVKITVGNVTKVVGPGSIAWAIPGDPIGTENVGTTPLTYYVLQFRSHTPIDVARAKSAGGSFLIDWKDVVMKKTEKGGRREMFDRATAMFERFEMHVTTLNQGVASHDPHTHPAEEALLLRFGDATMIIDNDQIPATSGAIVFLASQIPHALKNTGNGQSEYYAFQWQQKK